MATAQEIQTWATNIGLDVCIGELFAAEHNGKLPLNNTELCQWAHSTGRRSPDGVWICKSAMPSPLPWSTLATNWIKSNPIPAAVIAFVLFRNITRRGRR